jgi:hypothetical protein
VNQKDDGSRSSDPVMVSRTPTNSRTSPMPSTTTADADEPRLRKRRPAVNEDGSAVDPDANSGGGWRRADESDRASVTQSLHLCRQKPRRAQRRKRLRRRWNLRPSSRKKVAGVGETGQEPSCGPPQLVS